MTLKNGSICQEHDCAFHHIHGTLAYYKLVENKVEATP
jgi:hypothetical protein